MAGFTSVDDLINEVTTNDKLLEAWVNEQPPKEPQKAP